MLLLLTLVGANADSPPPCPTVARVPPPPPPEVHDGAVHRFVFLTEADRRELVHHYGSAPPSMDPKRLPAGNDSKTMLTFLGVQPNGGAAWLNGGPVSVTLDGNNLGEGSGGTVLLDRDLRAPSQRGWR